MENIDYDLELNFLKSPEQLEAERLENERNNRRTSSDKELPPSSVTQNNIPMIPDRKSKPVSNNMVIPTTRSSESLEIINNDLNKANRGLTSLSSLRKQLETGNDARPVKNTNIENDRQQEITNTTEIEIKNKPVPVIDRTLKPKSNVNNNKTGHGVDDASGVGVVEQSEGTESPEIKDVDSSIHVSDFNICLYL